MKHILNTADNTATLFAKGGSTTIIVSADLVAGHPEGHNKADNALFTRIKWLADYGQLDLKGVITAEALAQAQAVADAAKAAEADARVALAVARLESAISLLSERTGVQFSLHLPPRGESIVTVADVLRRAQDRSESAYRELNDLKSSPAKLRAALKRAVAAKEKAAKVEKFQRKVDAAFAALKAPASPVEGRGNVRVCFPCLNSSSLRLIWASIPRSHKYSSSYGGVSRYVSPEADAIVAKLMLIK